MPDLLTILTATSPFWWQGVKRGAQVLIDAAEDVLDEEAKKQTRKALKPVLDRLNQPEAEIAFVEAFNDACRAYLGRYGGGERELPKAVVDLLQRAVGKDLHDASSEVLQSYLLTDQPQRAPLDRWVQRQLGGQSLVTGEGRVFTQEEVTAELDVFFRDLRTAFLGHRFFSKEVFQVAVLDLLTQLRDAHIKKTADPAQMEEEYLAYVSRQNESIELRGIAPRIQGREVMMRMNDLFVPLQAAPERDLPGDVYGQFLNSVEAALDAGASPQEALSSAREKYRLDLGDLPGDLDVKDPDALMTQLRLLLGTRAPAIAAGTDQLLSMADILAEERVVILGDPGMGKSTLLRYAAYAVANGDASLVGEAPLHRVPIVVRIASFARTRQEEPDISLVEYARDRLEKDFAPLLTQRLDDDRCLLLLDGLDEVTDPHQRGQVVGEIEKLIARYPQNKYVVTSRIVGYEQARLDAQFGHFTLAPLRPETITKFVTSWYEAIERGAGADLKPGEAEAQARELTEAIEGHPGIQRLATNPLLLTIIAMVNRRGRKLPNRRVELYEIACETLIENWPLHRPGVKLDAEQITTILAPIAYHIFATQEGQYISKRDLMPRLTSAIREESDITKKEARETTKAWLDTVSSHSGIFLERGYDELGHPVYGFLHLTFLEYLTACHLAVRWVEGELPLEKFCHVPRWAEVVQLMVAKIGLSGRPQATRILQQIMELDSPYEDELHTDLLLAGACLADDLRIKPDLSRAVIEGLVGIAADTSIEPLREAVFTLFGRMRGTSHKRGAAAAVLPFLQDENVSVRYSAARALSPIASSDPQTNSSLRRRLADGESHVRSAAVRALAQIAPSDTQTISALLDRIADEAPAARSLAASALARIAPSDPQTISALLDLLADEDRWVRYGAINDLTQVAPSDPQTISSLRDRLADDNWLVRSAAARALAQIAPSDAQPISSLLDLLAEKHWPARSEAVRALAQVAPSDPQTISSLLHLLADEHWRVRSAAARALAQIAPSDPQTISSLLHLLADEDSDVRYVAASALAQIAPSDPQTISSLLDLLADEDSDVRYAAASALAQIAPSDPQTISSLRHLLVNENSNVRHAAASALARLAPSDPQTISSLRHLLAEKDWRVREAAARALAHKAPSDPQAVSCLRDLVADDDSNVRYVAASALAGIAPPDHKTMSALGALLDDTSQGTSWNRVCDAAYESILLLLQKGAKKPPLLEN